MEAPMMGKLWQGFSESQLTGLSPLVVQALMASHSEDPSGLGSTVLTSNAPTEYSETPASFYNNIQHVANDNIVKEHHSDSAATRYRQDSPNGAAAMAGEKPDDSSRVMPIAIVGMSCRFPGGANDIEKFWQIVSEGRSAWSEVPENRFSINGFYHPDPERIDCMNVKAAHFLQGTDGSEFDASFFNISPNEAKAMEPKARMHLESAYEALENAGITISEVAGSDTAVFVGAFNNDYYTMMARDPCIVPPYKVTGLGASLFSNRISYWFDLKGPSTTVDTACSASMTALHMACDTLRKGDSKMAIVSGANLMLDPDIMLGLSTLKFLSPDGKTYMFDERANGYSRGEGIGTLVIKPLSDAIEHKDPVYAIIRNTRTNQDGRTPGITMPNQEAQRSLIQATYAEAGLDPSETDFFEAHGTGTQAGDRAEAAALAAALGSTTRSSHNPLHVGSIKTVLGHCEGASGIAGVMHAVMALKNKCILPNCNFEIPSSQINFDSWRIKVPTYLQSWTTHNTRRASINSFGYGGTNVHAILEESLEQPESSSNIAGSGRVQSSGLAEQLPNTQGRKLLAFSAHDADGIQRQAGVLTRYFKSRDCQKRMDNLIFTLCQRRSMLKYKCAIHGKSVQELESKLEQLHYKPPQTIKSERLAFVFTGQGAQWPKMGCELMTSSPVFRKSFETADKHVTSLGATWSLLDELFRNATDSKINEAYLSQPLCTALQIALVDLLESWAVKPNTVVGHSSGEIAAAYAAGMLTLQSAMSVAYYRGELSSRLYPGQGVPKGAMLAVGLSAEDVQPFLGDTISGIATVACINSPKSVTVSGDNEAIDTLHSRLEAKGLFSRKLKVNVAYHSSHMKAIAEEYSKSLSGLTVQPRKPDIKFCSSVLPGLTVETDGEYWVQNLLSPVRFSDAMRKVISFDSEHDLRIGACVEIGPHAALAGPFKQVCEDLSPDIRPPYFPSVLRDKDSVESLLELACSLFSRGWKIDLAAVNFPIGRTGLRVLTDLPPYPWNHSTRHWHEGRLTQNFRSRKQPPHDLLGSLSDDSSDIDMRWSKYIRLSELPWLKDHVVHSEILLPAAAYLAMAVEAMGQKATISGLEPENYVLRDITFSKALVVPDSSTGVEVSFLLEPLRHSSASASTSWHEFRVISFGAERKAYEHCHGLISISQAPGFIFPSTDEANLAAMRNSKAMQSGLYEKWSSEARKAGNELGPSFHLIPKCCMRNDSIFCTLRVPDSASEMPFRHLSPQLVNVPVMDSILQVTVLSIADMIQPLDGMKIPVSIAELAISAKMTDAPGYEFLCRGSTTVLSPRDLQGRAIVTQEGEDGMLVPVVQVKGAKYVCIARDYESNEKRIKADSKLYWKVQLREDVDHLSQAAATSLWRVPDIERNEKSEAVICERAAWYCIRSAYEALSDADFINMAPHHRNYHQWMQKRYNLGQQGLLLFQTAEWSSIDSTEIEKTLKEATALRAQGQMVVRLGRRLLDILRGKIDPLSLMLEDDLLNKYYATSRTQDRVYKQVARFGELAAHKNPKLRVLEIGAGTGSATSWLLKALGGYDNKYPRFISYDFTDISTGFFEKAKAKFKAWGSLLSYKALNIEQDLNAQGFNEEEYDLIVAANVLHATHKMDHTMSQVHRLLKPGGKLILIEATAQRQISGQLIFGLLPGWWMGVNEGRVDSPLLTEDEWVKILKNSGFSGIDICIRDSEDEDMYTTAMMVSTSVDARDQVDPTNNISVVYDTSNEQAAANVLSSKLKSLGLAAGTKSLCKTAAFDEEIFVIIDHSKSSFLLGLDEQRLGLVQSIFAQARGVLWVTFGGSHNTSAGAVPGFVRSLRAEAGGMKFVTCDIDDDRNVINGNVADRVVEIFTKTFGKSNMSASIGDFEFAIHDGRIEIPRIVEEESANAAVTTRPNACTPVTQPLWQDECRLRLDMGHVGLLDTFRFVHDDVLDPHVNDDEVEIEISSVGLNFHDLMIATGQLPDPDGYGVECAGVISQTGTDSGQNLKIGDRVCALAKSCFATHARATASLVSTIPKDMSFDTAASIPSVFTTAYYCLYHAAKLQKNESILIHSAGGGIGQACIKMAQLIGADIFATVGSSSKADFLEKTFCIPRSHILNSRSLEFGSQIMSLTESKGVDVIINSLAGDALRESWRCTAMFGRFVELGKRDAIENARLDMAPFERSASFICVGWDHFGAHRTEFVGSVLKTVMSLFSDKSLTSLSPITTFPMSKVEEAFRYMASGSHIGKIVVTADKNCLVQALSKPSPPLQLRDDASYLLVGGLGGISIEMAKWFVHGLGAKSLILISRSGMEAGGAADAVDTLRKSGTTITVRKCDVANFEQLSSVLHECSQSLPPIWGVVQGAMVLKDAILPNMSLTKYYQALNPKVRGSQNLHDYFLKSPNKLDFFVMLSSLGGLLGNPSQSNYNAGNTFQDALAYYRATQGLPALAIDVGKVVDAGWVARNQDIPSRGVLAEARDIRVKDLTALISYHSARNSNNADQGINSTSTSSPPQIAVGIQDFPLWDARFSHVRASLMQTSSKKEENLGPSQSLESQITAANKDSKKVQGLILEAFRQKLSRLLSLPVEEVHEEDTIAGHGVDSLVAVEIRNWLRKEVSANVTVFEILNGKKSVRQVVNDIVAQMAVA